MAFHDMQPKAHGLEQLFGCLGGMTALVQRGDQVAVPLDATAGESVGAAGAAGQD